MKIPVRTTEGHRHDTTRGETRRCIVPGFVTLSCTAGYLGRTHSRTQPMRRLLGLTLISAAMACSDATAPLVEEQDLWADSGLQWADVGRTCEPSAPARALTAEQRATLPGPSPISDSELAELTRDVTGGFGGIMVPDGVWTMYLVDPSARDEATAELLALDAIPRAPQVVLKGRWTFAEMFDWQQYLFVNMGFPAGMVYADVQEARNRLEFGVLDEAARAELEAGLTALDVPCYLVAIGISAPIVSR